jgi:DNA-binding CsgD family transcriptional regulator
VDGQVVEKPPKTSAGARVLPLDDALVAQLRAFKALQAREKLAAGEAYDGTGDYMLCDELGTPFAPDKLRRVWYRLMRQAGVRRIKPYTASRHAADSYLDLVGVSPAVIAGASGFLLKTAPPARLIDAVRIIAAGEALLAPTVTRRLIASLVRRPPPGYATPPELRALTEREIQVLKMAARGMSNLEIAQSLIVSEATVKSHINRLFAKLHIRDRVQAVVLA